jgi:hypothetical protein
LFQLRAQGGVLFSQLPDLLLQGGDVGPDRITVHLTVWTQALRFLFKYF